MDAIKYYMLKFEEAVEYKTESSIEYFLTCLISCDLTEQQTRDLEEVLVNSAVVIAGKCCFNRGFTVNYADIFDKILEEILKKGFNSSKIKSGFPYYFFNYFLSHKSEDFLNRVQKNSNYLSQSCYQHLLSNIAAKGDKQLFIDFLKFGKDKSLQHINKVKEDILPFFLQLEKEDIEHLLGSFNLEEKKVIISYIRNEVDSLVNLEEKFKLLDLIINKCLDDKERKKFIELLVNKKGCYICISCIIKGKEKLANDFLDFCFPQNQDKVYKLKKSMLFCNKVEIINIILNYYTKSTSSELKVLFEKVFKWSALLESEQTEFKEGIIQCKGCSISFVLINKKDYFSVDEFLNWCCSGEQEKINKLKHTLLFRGKWGRDFCISNMQNKNSDEVKKFLKFVNLPKEKNDQLLIQCKDMFMKLGTNDMYLKLEDIFNSVNNEKQ